MIIIVMIIISPRPPVPGLAADAGRIHANIVNTDIMNTDIVNTLYIYIYIYIHRYRYRYRYIQIYSLYIIQMLYTFRIVNTDIDNFRIYHIILEYR